MKIENIKIKEIVFKRQGKKALMVFIGENDKHYSLMGYDEVNRINVPMNIVEVDEKIWEDKKK